MKAKDVQIGEVYSIKVGANVMGVRIIKENPYGGWSGININTNKPIRIRNAFVSGACGKMAARNRPR